MSPQPRTIAGPMQGKVCLVTGGTAGIGLVTARELARLGATVVINGRNQERGQRAARAIFSATNATPHFIAADLSSQAQVRRLAEEFRANHRRLDVLVNNAGALFALRRESVDGVEMTFALNHLAPFLLTQLLMDPLRAAGQARIVNVSSDAHRDVSSVDLEDPQAKRRAYPTSEAGSLLYCLTMPWAHTGFMQYARSKLANILFTLSLTQRLAGTAITANSLHPGLVASEFGSGNGVLGFFMQRFIARRGISVEEGAATSIYASTSADLTGVSGAYLVKCRATEPAAPARQAAADQRLWEMSEGLTRAL